MSGAPHCRVLTRGRRGRWSPRRVLPRTHCRPRSSTTAVADIAAVDSLMDEFPQRFSAEIDVLELILASTAAFLQNTSCRDSDIGVAGLVHGFAEQIWGGRDHDRELAEPVAAFLAGEAAWLIAYAAGVPGADRHSHAVADTLTWLDTAPRPLRAQLVRAALRYLP